MSSSGKEVQNINNSIVQRSTQSQSHLQKEKEARRDAEDRIRSFNYAKSIGGINSAAGKEGDEIKPLSSLAQGYLRSIAGNNRDELDDNGDGGGAGAGPSASNDSAQGQTIHIMPDMSVRDNAAAVEVDNTAASMAAKSETKNDIEGDEIHVPIEGERTDIAAAKDQHKDLPSSSIDDDETNSAMIHEDMNAGSDNDVGEVVASLDSAALDDGDISSERRGEEEGGGGDEDGKDSIITLGIAEMSAAADAGATTTIHESEVPSKDRTEGDDKATSLDDSSDAIPPIRNEDNIEETNNGNIDNSEGDIAADVDFEVDNTPTPNTEDDETHDAIEDERENNGISAEDQHKDLPLSSIDDDETNSAVIHEDMNPGSDNDVGEVDASSDLAAFDDGDISSERREEEGGGGGDEDGKDSIILLGAAAAADAGATAIDESEVPSTDRTEGDEKATGLDGSSDVFQSIPENEAVPNSDCIEDTNNDNLDRSVRDNAAAVDFEVDNTPASTVEEFTTSQLPNDNDDAEIHETIEEESASISAETDYKDLPHSNIDNDESNPAMIHADYSAGSDNEEGEVDSDSFALNEVASSKRGDEEGSKSNKMLVAAKEAEVAGGAAVASTTIDGREVPSNPNEGVDNATSLGSSKDVFQSIPENEAIHSYDNFDETNNNIMSTTCIDGEEELDEDEDEDQTEYCGSLAGTIATGALARRTNEFSDQSDHAVIDEELQGTSTTPTPQDNDAPPAQSPPSDDLSDGGEIIGRPTKRWKWLLILSALAIALAVVAGMGVGVDRGLNHIDNASIIIIPVPTQSPTSGPSLSLIPSDLPSSLPSSKPSAEPSAPPSISAVPSISPTVTFPPTISAAPSSEPSQQPSLSTQPSSKPSTAPSISAQPTGSPSESPTLSSQPSAEPTSSPSLSSAPSAAPSTSPTISTMPSASPSASPTNLVSSSD